MIRKTLFVLTFLCPLTQGFTETIEEKLATLGSNSQTHSESKGAKVFSKGSFSLIRKELNEKYKQVEKLIELKADEEEFLELLDQINELREELYQAESFMRETQVDEVLQESDPYGMWQQEEITVSQLIMEHGSQEYLYIIPPELVAMKVHIHSSLMVPKESWPTLLEAILKHNGIGLKEVNSYTKQVYSLKMDLTAFVAVTSHIYELEALDPRARVAHIYSPKVENLKSAFYFLERFRDPKTAFVYQVGSKIALVGFQDEIKRLISLVENVWTNDEEKVTKVVATTKIPPDEVIKILKNYFNGLADGRGMMPMKGGNDLSVLPLNGTGVILIGPAGVVARAEELIKSTEHQVEDPYELTVFWYACSHTNPTDLAEILEEVYTSLISSTGIEGGRGGSSSDQGFDSSYPSQPVDGNQMPPSPSFDHAGQYAPNSLALERPYRPGHPFPQEEKESKESRSQKHAGNFIPYPAAGKLLMVVRKDIIPKIKEVIKRLDVPKRMVEIEVLLCERQLVNSTRSGINLLKLGTGASYTKTGGVSYERTDETVTKGLFEFFFSRPSSSAFPAFDVSYNFLLSQDDVKVTASPSVLAINQTPATIAITDQISINNGASPVDTNSGIVFKESYDRADFGIVLTLTPTIHEPDIDDPNGEIYVTLDNDISFERIKGEVRSHDRPDVHKRRIKNQVRIADGQTIILGGLRSKMVEDKNEKIPFLGEIPGLGKLFGTTVLNDKSSEMFIFIKPRVIHDPKLDLARIRDEMLKSRQGDIVELLRKIKESREKKKKILFQESFDLLFSKNNGDLNLDS